MDKLTGMTSVVLRNTSSSWFSRVGAIALDTRHCWYSVARIFCDLRFLNDRYDGSSSIMRGTRDTFNAGASIERDWSRCSSRKVRNQRLSPTDVIRSSNTVRVFNLDTPSRKSLLAGPRYFNDRRAGEDMDSRGRMDDMLSLVPAFAETSRDLKRDPMRRKRQGGPSRASGPTSRL